MKIRKLLGGTLLASLLALGVGVGVASKAPVKAEPVAADEDTWMSNFSFNAGALLEIEGFDPNSIYVHTYTDGVGNDRYFNMFPIKSGSQYYSVNATFPSWYTYNRVQFKLQVGGEDKWASPYSESASEGSHYKQVYCTFGSWNEGENWTFSLRTTNNLFIDYAPSGQHNSYYFEEDVGSASFVVRDFVADEVNTKYYSIDYRDSWAFARLTLSDVDADKTNPNSVMTYVTDEWCSMKEGTYDVILKNNNSGNGLLEFRKHTSQESYVYLVGGDINPNVWVYTFSSGGVEQFGSFPGTQLKDITGYQDITGDMYFQGLDVSAFYLPLEIGYPAADHLILAWKNEYGVVANQSANMLLVEDSAYWFSYEAEYHNDEAGEALTFLWNFENVRKSTANESICELSQSQAEDIVNRYNNLSSNIVRSTYVDCTTINTWKGAEKDAKQYTRVDAMLKVVEEIAGVSLVSSSLVTMGYENQISNNGALYASIAIVSLISVSLLVTLVIVKKRKHN